MRVLSSPGRPRFLHATAAAAPAPLEWPGSQGCARPPRGTSARHIPQQPTPPLKGRREGEKCFQPSSLYQILKKFT